MIDSARTSRLVKLERMLAEGKISDEEYEAACEELKGVEMLGGEPEEAQSSSPLSSGHSPPAAGAVGEVSVQGPSSRGSARSPAAAGASRSVALGGRVRKAPRLYEVPIRVWIVALVAAVLGVAPLTSHSHLSAPAVGSAVIGLTLGFFLLRRAAWAYAVAVALCLAEILKSLVDREVASFLVNLAILAVLGSAVDWFFGTSFFAPPRETPPGG